MAVEGGVIMCDVPLPNVVTTIRVGDFTLRAYGYRTLSKAECRLAVDLYLQTCKLSKLPARGRGVVYTTFGIDS